MNFYASREYLEVVADVYFKGRRTHVEDVAIDGSVLRLLVVDERPITSHLFLDYHEPLRGSEMGSHPRGGGYAEAVVRDVIDIDAWSPAAFPGLDIAPYVEWSRFPTYADYLAFVLGREKGLVRERERRRRRLTEKHGALAFAMDDDRDDVSPFAREWKGRQLRETGYPDYFADERTIEYLARLREKGLLTTSTLRAEGRLLSVWVGFVYDGVWSGWVFTYDPEFRKYSVGHQLVCAMLECSHALGHRQFDFSVGAEDYKMMYATHGRVLGPLGRPPLAQRVLRFGKGLARERLPRVFEAARSLKVAARAR